MGYVKRILKKKLPSLLTCLYGERKYIDILKKYKSGLKMRSKAGDNLRPTIVFIIQFPEVWNSLKTVYEAAVSNNLNPIVLCIPKPKVNYSSQYILRDDGENEAFDFFKSRNVNVVDAYDKERRKWFRLDLFEPDYVVYARPYNSQYPDNYKSTEVCSYAKVCYIPYAYSQTTDGLFAASFNYNFTLAAYLTFVPSRIRLEECYKRFRLQILRNSHKYIYLGFPRFDLLAEFNKENNKELKTIIWLPRWTVDHTEGQKKSSFFKYVDKFIAYMDKHKELNLIIRPHPLMFSVIIETNMMSGDEVDALKHRVNKLPNVEFDPNTDYLETFRRGDILVSDFTSLLSEYFVTGKPIIYCDTNENFNTDAMLMDSVMYHADKWEDIENNIGNLLINGDTRYRERQEIIDMLIPGNAGHIGENIINYIIDDFNSV